MSSKSLNLERLLALYNSFMWDIVRAFKDSEWTERELREYLVEHNVNLSSHTLLRYVVLYDRIKKLGYSDNAVDKRTPRQWMEFMKQFKDKEKK